MTNAKSMVAGKSFAQRADKVRLSEQLFTALSLANCPLSLGECFTAIRGGNKFVLGNKANTVILTARVVNNGNSRVRDEVAAICALSPLLSFSLRNLKFLSPRLKVAVACVDAINGKSIYASSRKGVFRDSVSSIKFD